MATDLDRTVTVGMTGASGAQYGLRLVECLLQADWTVYLTFTRAAQIVIGSETDCRLPGRTAEQTRHLSELFKAREGQLRVFGDEEWTSPLASGSFGSSQGCNGLHPCSAAATQASSSRWRARVTAT